MNKAIQYTALAMLIIANGHAQAAFSTAVREAITPESMKEETQNVLLPIVLENSNNPLNLSAKLANLKPAAAELGLEQMSIGGIAEITTANEGQQDFKIHWNSASITDENGKKFTTYIGNPLKSAVTATPELTTGDEFAAEGDPNELLAAFQRLQQMMNDEEASEKEEEKEEVVETTEFGGRDSGAREIDEIEPNFEIAPDPVITSTTDGCSINVDTAQMAAIVQERVLEDGQEIIACQDTDTRYPITRKYSTCSDFVDFENNQVLRQFTLNYTDPETGGAIQVQDCTPDEEEAIAIIEDVNSCSLRHDFAANKSVQQSRMIYTDSNGNLQEIQSCQDTEAEYAHVVTQNTCSPVIDADNNLVTFRERTLINKDGTEQYITECAPNTANTAAIIETVCTSPKYTHDFDAGQSYVNKSYHYLSGGDEIEVQGCTQSEETLVHQLDTSVCTHVNDDTTKMTTMYARPYIEETEGVPTYIASCETVSPAIPYVKTGSTWNKESQGMQSITMNDSAYANIDILTNQFTCERRIGGSRINIAQYLSGQQYAVRNSVDYLPWKFGEITINSELSDQEPAISNRMLIPSNYATECNASYDQTRPKNTAATANGATCQISKMDKHPVYLRGDASTFTDSDTVEETTYLCGTGSNLEGVTE